MELPVDGAGEHDAAGEERSPLVKQASEHDAPPLARSKWWQTMAILVGEVMGTGVLSLPYACSKLGWGLGVAALIFFAGTAIYASLCADGTNTRPRAPAFARTRAHAHTNSDAEGGGLCEADGFD